MRLSRKSKKGLQDIDDLYFSIIISNIDVHRWSTFILPFNDNTSLSNVPQYLCQKKFLTSKETDRAIDV